MPAEKKKISQSEASYGKHSARVARLTKDNAGGAPKNSSTRSRGRPPIVDEFSNLPCSRQRKWQLRKAKGGLCMICGRPQEVAFLCRTHSIKYAIYGRERQREVKGHVRRNLGARLYQLNSQTCMMNDLLGPLWQKLRERLQRATRNRGAQAALANEFGVTSVTVSKWLSADERQCAVPSAEKTLRLLAWVTAHEAEPQERAKKSKLSQENVEAFHLQIAPFENSL